MIRKDGILYLGVNYKEYFLTFVFGCCGRKRVRPKYYLLYRKVQHFQIFQTNLIIRENNWWVGTDDSIEVSQLAKLIKKIEYKFYIPRRVRVDLGL